METEGSQEPATNPYPEPDASSPLLRPYFPKDHTNVMFPSMPMFS